MVKILKQNYIQNKKKYIKLEKRLREIIGNNCLIEHVGSTAIPNMFGKNIIDVLIGAKNNKSFFDISNKIIKEGFFPSLNSKTDIYQFFASTEKETKSGDVHIHLVMENTERFSEFIVLRDYLLSNRKEVMDYSNFKLLICNQYSKERKEYKKIKSNYVTELIKKAKIWEKTNL